MSHSHMIVSRLPWRYLDETWRLYRPPRLLLNFPISHHHLLYNSLLSFFFFISMVCRYHLLFLNTLYTSVHSSFIHKLFNTNINCSTALCWRRVCTGYHLLFNSGLPNTMLRNAHMESYQFREYCFQANKKKVWNKHAKPRNRKKRMSAQIVITQSR